MALAGAKPKTDRSQIRHSVPPEHEWREYEDVPYLDGPPLPPRTISEGPDAPVGALDRWPDATMRWYRSVSRMPHARDWRPGMWETVWRIAELHARFSEGWKGHGGSELRISQKVLGMTDDDLRDLRIRYVPVGTMAKRAKEKRAKASAGGAGSAAVAKLDDYRDL